MSAKTMKPQMPYDVDFAVEYRVLKWISGRNVWCLSFQTPYLDRAMDALGDGTNTRLERCIWEPAPELAASCPTAPAVAGDDGNTEPVFSPPDLTQGTCPTTPGLGAGGSNV